MAPSTVKPNSEAGILAQAAVDRVCNTTELLEAILLHLPTHGLLFAQCVCKQWQAVIEGSVSIKKALFLVPGVSTDTNEENKVAAIPRARDQRPQDSRHEQVAEIFNSGVIVINRLLTMRTSADQVPSRHNFGTRPRGPRCLAFLHPDILLSRPSSSCLAMYITQPPMDVEVVDVNFGSLWALEPRHPRPASPRTFPRVRTVGELVGAVKEQIEGREKLKIVKCLRVVLGFNHDDVMAAVQWEAA